MPNAALSTGLILSLVASFLAGWAVALKTNAPVEVGEPPVEWIDKTIRYQFRVQNTRPEVMKSVDVTVYAPSHIEGRQHVLSVNANYDFSMASSGFGNDELHFTFDELPPFGSKQIIVTAQISLPVSAAPASLSDKELYLREEPYIELSDEAVRKQAISLVTPVAGSTVNGIYNWLIDHVEDNGLTMADKGASYALETGRGDCTEFMYLFSALARVNNIPTRNLGGFVLAQNGILRATAYHNWAEYYSAGRWHIADAQRQVLDDEYGSYVIMRSLTSSGDSVKHSERFVSFTPGLKLTMD